MGLSNICFAAVAAAVDAAVTAAVTVAVTHAVAVVHLTDSS